MVCYESVQRVPNLIVDLSVTLRCSPYTLFGSLMSKIWAKNVVRHIFKLDSMCPVGTKLPIFDKHQPHSTGCDKDIASFGSCRYYVRFDRGSAGTRYT